MINMKKIDYQNAFVKAAFIAMVWDPTNTDASKLMAWCRKSLPADWCAQAAREIGSLRLRRQWFDSQLHGKQPPVVLAAVRRHYEREFQKVYPTGHASPTRYPSPGGSVTEETIPENPSNHAAHFRQKGQTHTKVCLHT